MQETPVWFLGQEDPLEKGKVTHSSILDWRIPWIVYSMGLQRVRHDWMTFTFTVDLRRGGLSGGMGRLIWSPCSFLVAQLCLTLCDPMDYSLPGSSVHGILQARILEWVAISFCRGFFPTQGLNLCLLHCRRVLYHWAAREALISSQKPPKAEGIFWLVGGNTHVREIPTARRIQCAAAALNLEEAIRGEVQMLSVDPRLEPAGKRKSQSCDCK